VLDAKREEYDALLTPDERERHRRFRFEKDRNLFLATRALVRSTLSRYAAVAPHDWRFSAGEQGKPFIAQPAGGEPLHFNLSNTPGLVVCGVSSAHEALGVDVESRDRKSAALEVADHWFSSDEVSSLRTLPESEQRDRFFRIWTLKESYIKARGAGLSLPLDAFSFTLGDDDVSVRFEERLEDDAARWRFALVDAEPRYVVAVSAETGGAPLSLRAAPFLG
jgi:4'-phosphopantetheinyl transferase